MSIKINVGCGNNPTKEWTNYDNSWSIRLAKYPLFTSLLSKLGILSTSQKQFINFAMKEKIIWSDATKLIPENDKSVDVVYSSHMIEHLDREEVLSFLKEARRVLKNDGIIRIVVPNIKIFVEEYLKEGDADKFMESMYLTRIKPKNIRTTIKYLLIGERNHQWMYDDKSLCKLLILAGFKDPTKTEEGKTIITDPGKLDLKERSQESVFVEAKNP